MGMIGYKIMADSYRKLAASGQMSEEDVKTEVKVYDFLAGCSEEEVLCLAGSGAFNDIIKAYIKKALSAASFTEDATERVLAELNYLFDTAQIGEIMKE